MRTFRAEDHQSQDGSLGAALTPKIVNTVKTIFPVIKLAPGLPGVCGSAERNGQECDRLGGSDAAGQALKLGHISSV